MVGIVESGHHTPPHDDCMGIMCDYGCNDEHF